MAYKVPLTKDDLPSLKHSLKPETLQQVVVALEASKQVEFEYSSFSDPGADFTNIQVEGKTIASIPGY